MQNFSYQATFAGQGGIFPCQWTVVAGALPSGLSLNKSSGLLSPCCTSIQTAVNTAGTGTVIMVTKGPYTEAVTLNASKSLTILGGWNESYDQQTSNSTFIKAPKAPAGSLRLQEVTVKP